MRPLPPPSTAVGAALVAFAGVLVAAACGSAEEEASLPPDGGAPAVSLGDASYVDAQEYDGGEVDRSRVDGGFGGPDGAVLREDRFVTTVVSFTPGGCAGFGASRMPSIVVGPPVGSGDLSGSLDVVSLGVGGEIVVGFEPNAIVDGPGPDFIVFENAFFAGGNRAQPVVDPGEVAVSEDGVTWHTYACAPAAEGTADLGTCAGWHPVYSAPGNGISPVDARVAGGEAYDLSALGISRARFVRVRDRSTTKCEGVRPRPSNAGFDLDAVAVVNAEKP